MPFRGKLQYLGYQFSPVQSLSHVWLFATPWNCSTPDFPVHHHLPELAQAHVHWIGDAIQTSHLLSFTFLLVQSFPASRSFPVSQFFTSSGQIISASASVLPMNIQDWLSLLLTGWISLQSKGFSRVFSNTTIQKYQLSGSQLSLWSNYHTHTWMTTGKTIALTTWTFIAK